METTNIINPDIPSTHYIFQELFSVRTRQEALQTEEEVRRFGVRSTGFGQYDTQLFGQYTTCYLPIARMATIFEKGYEVLLINHSDAKRVYEYIQYHLESWMRLIGGGVNTVMAPYDDLRLLDRFAGAVYGIAAHQYNGADNQSTFSRWLSQFSDLSEAAFLPVPSDQPAEPEIKPRVSMQDALLEHQSKLYR